MSLVLWPFLLQRLTQTLNDTNTNSLMWWCRYVDRYSSLLYAILLFHRSNIPNMRYQATGIVRLFQYMSFI